jgi:hypothetical protein
MTTSKNLTIAEAMQQGNSTTNQNIKGKFVAQHVHANVNSMCEYILSKSWEDSKAPFNFDDVENFYVYPEWSKTVVGEDLFFDGGNEDAKNSFLENFERLENESLELFENETISEETHERNCSIIEDAKSEFQDLETENCEVFEWWLVSSYLCEKLQQMGYCVIDSESIWGRTTTGQAILLDYEITQICAEMEILDGQKNSWA